jgi:hypothetical protein
MTMPAIGVNGGVVDLGASAGIRALRTTWMPRYVLPRIYERVSMPDNASLPTILVQKAREPDVVVVLDESEFFDKTSTQAHSVGSRTDRNLIHG